MQVQVQVQVQVRVQVQVQVQHRSGWTTVPTAGAGRSGVCLAQALALLVVACQPGQSALSAGLFGSASLLSKQALRNLDAPYPSSFSIVARACCCRRLNSPSSAGEFTVGWHALRCACNWPSALRTSRGGSRASSRSVRLVTLVTAPA